MAEADWEILLDSAYDQAIDRVTAALKTEGFGVLTRIDAHQAFKDKLGVDFHQYTILGACNPPLAYKAISSRPDVGLMLPCNVIVEAVGDHRTRVKIADPAAMLGVGGFAEDAVLQQVAGEAAMRLERVAEALRN